MPGLNFPRIVVELPLGIAGYPHLVKPDSYGSKMRSSGGDDKKETPKFKVRMMYAPEAVAGVREKLRPKMQEMLKAIGWEKLPVERMLEAIKDGTAYNDEREGNGNDRKPELDGLFFIDPSSQYKPDTRDAKRAKVSAAQIKGGDGIKALVQLVPHAFQGKKAIALRLLAVQLVQKNSGDADGWGSAFSEEDGYVAADGDDTTDPDPDAEGDAEDPPEDEEVDETPKPKRRKGGGGDAPSDY